ncbi:hydrogenase expression/formation protein HypE [Bradyrhizobium sp. Tv2a-2]|uniref:hydrogenase expression/formation protein HypE n=1 Tax=Bradyrhizobium sp. Tv2a-2 TaxID=113395 RepID=UPI000409DAB4|nr:hydrogenase expression/formation protein HypE [Bradyrhizobium sp. Tv2a-2]
MRAKSYQSKLDVRNGFVELRHGSGGRAMSQLVYSLFHEAFGNDWLARGNDQSAFGVQTGRMVMTTDSYVVSPRFFPGGNIGFLAVNGTINDVVAMAGARPLYLSASFIIEEGYRLSDLKTIAGSMGEAARTAGVNIITGDTKVVERGKADGLFISTTGIGVLPDGLDLSVDNARIGDRVLVSGSLGDDGITIMSKRQNLPFQSGLVSDTAPLHDLVAVMVTAGGSGIRVMRDPTRGGLAATLNEIANQSGLGFRLREEIIPVKPTVAAACELLGLDPLHVANEGKLVAIVAPETADAVLAAMKAHALGCDAADIGCAVEDDHQFVQMLTRFGGERIVEWLSGDQLPRIC